MRAIARFTCGLFLLMFLLGTENLPAQETSVKPSPDAQTLFDQLNNLDLDPHQIYVLRGAQITRGGVNFYFNRGFVGFLGRVRGEITGAVFSGSGEVLLMPPTTTERASLARFTGAPILEENFTFAYLRFTDDTARQLLTFARPPDPDDVEQPTGLPEHWSPIIKRLDPAFSLRILEDLVGGGEHPYFHAQLQGVEQGVFGVAVDERAAEAVAVGATRRTGGIAYSDIWCAFPSRTSTARQDSLMVGSVRARAYKIDTQIAADNSLVGHAEVELESLWPGERIVVLQLSNRLRVSEVLDEAGHELETFQASPPDESRGSNEADNWVAVALPSPPPVGTRFRLRFTYQGNVITDVGHGVLYVGDRGSWYPNRGPTDRADYDLSFRYPASLSLVATGDRVEEATEGDWKKSRWVSHGVFPVAGFNLGPYDSRVRHLGKTAIEVYATPEAEAALENRHAAAQTPTASIAIQPGTGRVLIIPDARPAVQLTPAALLDQVADSAARAVKYFETLFGNYPYSRLAIAQIPGQSGQGWPELVYLPTLSFLEDTERAAMGLDSRVTEFSDQSIVAHEVAHQWWGNKVGWSTQHDQWLSEGFASYAALLYLNQDKDGDRKVHEVLKAYKRDLLAKTPEGKTVESGGPIWLGHRLTNSLNPTGYNDIVYKKACWVLRMMHVLMTDPATGSDARFFKMLKDFVNAYRDKSPSTEDFIRFSEKYMTPAMDLDHNHHLAWFFDDWVYGTGIPTYRLQYTSRRVASNKYLTQGTIQQSGVPADFQMLVPIVGTFGREKKETLGLVAVSENGGRFRFTTSNKPTRVAVDEDNLLAEVK